MKLTRIRMIGRFINPETGRPVNVHTGDKKDTGIGILFFLRSGIRVYISDHKFWGKWEEVR